MSSPNSLIVAALVSAGALGVGLYTFWSRRPGSGKVDSESTKEGGEVASKKEAATGHGERHVEFALDRNEAFSPPASRRTSYSPTPEMGPASPMDPPPPLSPLSENQQHTLHHLTVSLWQAVRTGRQTEVLLATLKEAPKVELRATSTGRTILHECALHLAAGQEPLLDELFQTPEIRADINSPDTSCGGMTAFHLACATGKEAIVACFMRHLTVEQLDYANPSGWTALHFLAAKNRPRLVEALLKYGAQADPVNDAGYTPLLLALKAKAAASAILLSHNGVQLSRRSKSDGEANVLHLTTLTGFPMYEVAELAIQKHPELVNQQADDGRTPLHWSLQHGHGRLSLLLIRQGKADPLLGDRDNKVTPLHLASSANDVGILQACFDPLPRSQSVDVADVAGRTPLMAASIMGAEAAVALLIERGADINAKDLAGISCLHWALKNRHKGVAMKLLEKRCDVTATDLHGNTPLHIACYNGKLFGSVAELLVDRCPGDVNKADSEGRTPLHWAAAHGHVPLITSLLDAEANPLSKDSAGVYPIHWAARQSQADVLEQLIVEMESKHGLTSSDAANILDGQDRTPLLWLCQKLVNDAKARRSSDEGVIDSLQEEQNRPIPIPQAERAIKVLMRFGADPSRPSKDPGSPTPLSLLQSISQTGLLPTSIMHSSGAFHDGEAFGQEEGGAFGCSHPVQAFGDPFLQVAETFVPFPLPVPIGVPMEGSTAARSRRRGGSSSLPTAAEDHTDSSTAAPGGTGEAFADVMDSQPEDDPDVDEDPFSRNQPRGGGGGRRRATGYVAFQDTEEPEMETAGGGEELMDDADNEF